MTASVITDPFGTGRQSIVRWVGNSDSDGHRTFEVTHMVKTDSYSDGPHTVMNANGLPEVGEAWSFGNDFDFAAICTPQRSVTMLQPKEGQPGIIWHVTSIFSTNRNSRRCQDEQIDDPLQEPDRISGSFLRYTIEATKDRHGEPIKSSSHELFTGPQVEFDEGRPSVIISQNRPELELPLITQFVNKVNDAPLWGVGARKVKLSSATWSREVFGVCDYFFIRTFEFDINFNTFDREILDEGYKVLNGHLNPDTGVWVIDNFPGFGVPDPDNPNHFVHYKDVNGENVKVILNGAGEPIDQTGTPDFFFHTVEFYDEANFLLLGIPTDLEGT